MAAQATLAQRLLSGERRALAQAITLVESTLASHRQQALELLEVLTPHTGNSLRIGISGAPGVGKSTFIEALGNHLVENNHKVAVLAVDPSSTLNGGSILGDKTRMEKLALQANAYIRPSPAGNTLGGVARRTRESLLLCEAAGFDIILIETVGVGQSEVAVANMTDMFVLMLQPGSGDDLQGIKRGVIELADLILVNKADGASAKLAEKTAHDYQSVLGLLQPKSEYWAPQVASISAFSNKHIEGVWHTVEGYFSKLEKNISDLRNTQNIEWLWSETAERLMAELRADSAVKSAAEALEQAVKQSDIPPTMAAEKLLSIFRENKP
ncbi:methylmalonyl Co-A mutase-associated GTPase MeaB [Porticoccus sp. W117]|uniref:methylmalonyl Co-A mutase-associated GTPase MeaB n=1 Tax=Porticoccus sp. W117 TaxID=3054777 RepID=UPI0025966ED5|nr:methylmalonyl Co-A mutase-associated GTPase MeaB [Porticoccus sp. W117]MDM3870666.1 methylmalonyl Co-A mutase-associated GTPase MeaB [Porticoccus sp. W117]